MGKALVINGLVVPNPLSVITIKSVSSILAEYYTVNTSINQSEKLALETFVKGLLDANLWLKIKYFYPLLGDNVSDLTKEAISPSTEDLILNSGINGLSEGSRILLANNRPEKEKTIGSRAASLDASKLGIICAGKADTWFGGGQGIKFNDSANRFGIEVATNTSGFGYATLVVNGTSIYQESAYNTKLERVVFGNVQDGVGSLYDDSTLLANSNVNVAGYSLTKSYGILRNERASNYKYNFLAITEGMTSADWLVYYPLLLSYLRAVGKHS